MGVPNKKLKKLMMITGIALGVYAGFKYLLPLVIPFFIALGLAEMLRPAALWLQKKFSFSFHGKRFLCPLGMWGGNCPACLWSGDYGSDGSRRKKSFCRKEGFCFIICPGCWMKPIEYLAAGADVWKEHFNWRKTVLSL